MTSLKKAALALGLCTGLSMTSGAQASNDGVQTLKTLERERSALIAVMLDQSIDAEQRNEQLNSKVRRLIDLERLVLRDRKLEGNTDTIVRRAFRNYDLTFIAHASFEQDKSPAAHWLDSMGLDHEALFDSRLSGGF